MIACAIVACTPNNIIGINGKIPWHCPEDLQRFKRITMGHPVIMGRKTWQSIGQILPGRLNVVITKEYLKLLPHRYVGFDSIETALGMLEAAGYPEVFVIGGEHLYKASEPYLSRIYKTVIDVSPEMWIGDTVAKWPIRTDRTNWDLALKEQNGEITNYIYTRKRRGGR